MNWKMFQDYREIPTLASTRHSMSSADEFFQVGGNPIISSILASSFPKTHTCVRRNQFPLQNWKVVVQ
jgi:hypothetical protein